MALTDHELVRGDRTADSGKSRGGGVGMFINSKWCKNWSVKERVCTPHYDFLVVGLRPFYLPRELNQVFVMVTYIPPQANMKKLVNILLQK